MLGLFLMGFGHSSGGCGGSVYGGWDGFRLDCGLLQWWWALDQARDGDTCCLRGSNEPTGFK